jgi:hypothetical protein
MLPLDPEFKLGTLVWTTVLSPTPSQSHSTSLFKYSSKKYAIDSLVILNSLLTSIEIFVFVPSCVLTRPRTTASAILFAILGSLTILSISICGYRSVTS